MSEVPPQRWTKVLAITLLTLLGGFASFCVWYATVPGAGISPDSATYIGAARNLLAGNGLTIRGGPLTHFPPLLPVVLALGGLFGPDPAVVARWLNVLLMGANVFLIGYAIHRTTGAVWAALLAGGLTLAARDIVEVHTWAWSEPSMLLLGLAGLLLLCLHLEEPRRWRLVGAAVCLALALLARYAALPLIGTAVLGILIFHRERFLGRLREAGVFAAISCGPLAGWALRNSVVAETSTNRHFFAHPITERHFNSARATGARWFHAGTGKLPVEEQTTILWVALGVLVLLLAVLIWKTVRPNRNAAGVAQVPRLPWLLLIFALSYFGFLVVSISFFDFNTPLDSRILSPLHFALIAFVVAVGQIGCATNRWLRWVGAGLLLAAGWWAWPHGKNVQATLVKHHATGRGYASQKWRDCRFLERIRNLPEIPIYMNEVAGTTYHTGRLIKGVPARRDSVTAQLNANVAADVQRMKDDLTQNHGVFIILRLGGWRGNYVPRAELFEAMKLTSIEKTPEAEVFVIRPESPQP